MIMCRLPSVRRRSTIKSPGPLPRRLPWWASWAWRAPSRWLGQGSALSQELAGAPHGLHYLRHLARGNRITRRASFESASEDPPVLLIHGFLGTRGSMFPL
jgi:hypothetical protein